jgi:hypothetical protein
MAFLVTKGLGQSAIGQDTTFVATRGWGRGVTAAVVDKIKARTHDKFNDLRDYAAQAKREDEDLLVICQQLIKMICR